MTNPRLVQDIARYRQADLLRELQRARLAVRISEAADERPHRRLNLRSRAVALPALQAVRGSV